MRFTNPIATQGRGFDLQPGPPRRCKTHRPRATRFLARLLPLAAVAAAGLTGCHTLPGVAADGSATRIVAALEAGDHAPDRLDAPADPSRLSAAWTLAEAR